MIVVEGDSVTGAKGCRAPADENGVGHQLLQAGRGFQDFEQLRGERALVLLR